MTAIIENTPAAWSARAEAPASWEAALWSERGQTARFQAVLQHVQLRGGDTLLDFGCGTGRLHAFVARDVQYFAHDTSPGMLERAAETGATVLEKLPDLLFDHVVAVGPFNLADAWSVDRTFLTIADLWANHTRRSLVVSLYRGTDAACLSYDPQTVAGWAKTLGARRFVVDAHLDNDVILAVTR